MTESAGECVFVARGGRVGRSAYEGVRSMAVCATLGDSDRTHLDGGGGLVVEAAEGGVGGGSNPVFPPLRARHR